MFSDVKKKLLDNRKKHFPPLLHTQKKNLVPRKEIWRQEKKFCPDIKNYFFFGIRNNFCWSCSGEYYQF